MKLIVGLGNPGREYEKTRHNVGYLVASYLQEQKLPKGVLVKKSDQFMNESGLFVAKTLKAHKIKPKDLYLVHDDLDIKLGEYKIQFGRGPKDHNGVLSVDDSLGTNEYWHVRVGIDNRPGDNRVMGQEFVLQDFTKDELHILDSVIKELCKKLETSLKNTN